MLRRFGSIIINTAALIFLELMYWIVAEAELADMLSVMIGTGVALSLLIVLDIIDIFKDKHK